MPEWSTACPDWERRILNRESLIPFPPLFPEYAKKALDIFCSLRIVDQPGRPTFGEISAQWVFDLVSAIFGAYDEETGIQHIKEIFLMVAKKNSKSTLAAGIMMTSLILNWRESAELVILSPTVKVAGNSFKPASDMCRKDVDEDLGDLMVVQEHIKKITNLDTKAYLNVVAADSATVAGIKGSMHFVDEVWEFGKKHNSKNMLLEATGGLASRDEGFIVWATTQSDEPPTGIFKEKLDYARGVRDGKIIDNTFLPIIYEFPEWMIKEEKHLDPKNFYIPNPNYGKSVSESYLKRKFSQAQEDSKESVQSFLAKHLNVQIGVSMRHQKWAGSEFWEAATDERITLDYILERSEVVVAGVDGGGLDDLLGLAIVGREMDTGNWLAWCKAWCHPIALERRKSETTKYEDFKKDGDLRIVDKIGDDIFEVGEIIRKCLPWLDRVGVDQVGIGAIVDELVAGDEMGENGLDHDRIVGIPQGWRLNGAIKTTERKIAEKTLLHGDQPLMAWCVGNARTETRGNAVYVTKQASGTGKIDPLIALYNCVALLAMNPEAKITKSLYDKEESEIMTF